jgi:hypothetical protein
MHYKQSISAVLLVGLSSIVSAEPIVDIQKIAGKTPEDVAKALGKPSSQEKTKRGPKMLYKEGKVEVVFISGKADWVTIANVGDIPFNENAIQALGLKATAPTFKSESVIRWEPCGPYVSVAVFNANGRIDYVHIKVATQ